MLRDVFRRTAPFGQTEDAQYVGFGSLWFADFILFHRSLGIRRMVSIEEATGAAKRFNDNRPFDIRLMMESAAKAIPKIDWTTRQFVWLDYDGVFVNSMLRELSTVVSKVPVGSVIAITINVARAAEFSEDVEDDLSPVERFQEHFADFDVPATISEEDLIGYPFSKLVEKTVFETASRAVQARAGVDAQTYQFRRVCSFRYSDGVPMITLVGIVFNDAVAAKLEECAFSQLDFIQGTEGEVTIDVPILTARECVTLDAQLPVLGKGEIQFGSIPEREAKLYMRFYRHLPNYIVTET